VGRQNNGLKYLLCEAIVKGEHDLREETREENEFKTSCLRRENSFWKGVPERS